jgi:uncharacterized damage-inducible protein DinB
MNATELFQRWSEVRAGLVTALEKLADAQLDFTPRQGLWSLRETVVHIAGTEDGWLRSYTANRWHENPPEARDYPTVESLKNLLAEAHARTQAQFAQDAEGLLEQICQLPWGGQVSMGWAVWHVLEHEIHHRGEIYLMLGLMSKEAPDV